VNEYESSMEPRAEIRTMAKATREIYVSLVREGFKEHEALIIIGQIIASAKEQS